MIILPDRPWPQARPDWLAAERLGFDHAWTYDHLMWRWFRDKPWFAAVPTLSAAAAATERIALGTMVASPAFRHPVTLAKDVMTLDHIAGGRAICGIGAGAGGYDDTALGAGPLTGAQRADRFAEFVALTDRLLRQPETDHSGRYYTAAGVHVRPGCVQRPRVPLAVAATGPRGIGLAAAHADIWVTAGQPGWPSPVRYDRAVAGLRAQAAALDRACETAGRDPATVRRLVVTGAMIDGVLTSVESYRDACGLFAGIGVTDVVTHWPRPDFPYRARLDVLAGVAAEVLTERTAR
ncbi:LLM class flavin-dependent oxidoreductase [Actinophytocola sp. KF-1]